MGFVRGGRRSQELIHIGSDPDAGVEPDSPTSCQSRQGADTRLLAMWDIRTVRMPAPLLANRGFATGSGRRLHTLADLVAHAAAEGLVVRLDGTEIQVRRPRAGRPGRRTFVSGKRKQNTIKATIASDARGRMLWASEPSAHAGCTIRPRCGPKASTT
ncbi:transposase family protein [Plantactinospora sp. ZYX-F-223]